jgi:hypothetical protein
VSRLGSIVVLCLAVAPPAVLHARHGRQAWDQAPGTPPPTAKADIVDNVVFEK